MYQQMVTIVQYLMWIYGYVLIAVAVLSWIPDLSTTLFGAFIHRITEPFMRIFARLIPSVELGGVAINLSYVVGVIVYFILQQTVLGVLSALLARGLV